MRLRRLAMLVAVLGAALAAPRAFGAQILISAGQKWDDQVRLARPGDEIILMPGVHREGVLEGLKGTPEKPLVIRGLDKTNVATIRGGRYGLRLTRCRNIVFKHLVIDGAEINGILINSTGARRPKPGAADPTDEPAGLRFENVTVRNVGEEKRKRHAVELHRIADVTFHGCTIEGWGGVGIEIIGCANIIVRDCDVRGGDYSPVAGLRARAGSSDITVADSRFHAAGVSAICAGGASELKDFPIGVLENAVKAAIFEVRQITIERNVFVGGACAITLTHCDRATVLRNTIVDPGYYVFCLVQTQDNTQIGPTRRCTISRNIITWQAGALTSLFLIDDGVEVVTLKVEPNLWWSPESEGERARLGAIPNTERVPQKFDVDPKLDATHAPTAVEANGYGALQIRLPSNGVTRSR